MYSVADKKRLISLPWESPGHRASLRVPGTRAWSVWSRVIPISLDGRRGALPRLEVVESQKGQGGRLFRVFLALFPSFAGEPSLAESQDGAIHSVGFPLKSLISRKVDILLLGVFHGDALGRIPADGKLLPTTEQAVR